MSTVILTPPASLPGGRPGLKVEEKVEGKVEGGGVGRKEPHRKFLAST